MVLPLVLDPVLLLEDELLDEVVDLDDELDVEPLEATVEDCVGFLAAAKAFLTAREAGASDELAGKLLTSATRSD